MLGQIFGNAYDAVNDPGSNGFPPSEMPMPPAGPSFQDSLHWLTNGGLGGSSEMGAPPADPFARLNPPGMLGPAMNPFAPPAQTGDDKFRALIDSLQRKPPYDPNDIQKSYQTANDMNTKASGMTAPTPGTGLMNPKQALILGAIAAVAQGLSGKYAGPVGAEIVAGGNQGAAAAQNKAYQEAVNAQNAVKGKLLAQAQGAAQTAGYQAQQNAAINTYNQNIADHLASQYSWITGQKDEIERNKNLAKIQATGMLATARLDQGLLRQIANMAPAARPTFMQSIVDPTTGKAMFTDPSALEVFATMTPTDIMKTGAGKLYDAKTGQIVDPNSAYNQKLLAQAAQANATAKWRDTVAQYLPDDLKSKWEYWSNLGQAGLTRADAAKTAAATGQINAKTAQTNATTAQGNLAVNQQNAETNRQRLAATLSSQEALVIRTAASNAAKDIASQIDDLQSQMKTRTDLEDPASPGSKLTIRQDLQNQINAQQQQLTKANSLDVMLKQQHRLALTREYQANLKKLKAMVGVTTADVAALNEAYKAQTQQIENPSGP